MVGKNSLSPREKFKQYLTDCHLRKTPERFAILEKAITLPGHFGVDMLYDCMDSSGYHVSRATVYSTLNLLVDCGLLNRHIFGLRKTLYEVAVGSHLHLVCSSCGKIREIEEDDNAERLDHVELGDFTPTYSSTTIYGFCGDCRLKAARDADPTD